MVREIAKAYDPQLIENKWAEFWSSGDLFRADPAAPGPAFSIVIPPPNVTGSLHIGHMLDHTEIDILTRWHRMRGYNTLYLPGTDHAGISTQRVVVRQLAEQGINYRDLGREEFVKRVWKWKEESGGTIQRQMRQIGESCDWSREKFTLSPELSRVVREVFARLYEENLIYRANRMMNWCPVCLTVLSDLEVLHEERTGSLWHIRYPVTGTSEFIVVATTRPETMLGDTAVAVHPEDERYKHLLGMNVKLPLTGREVPVIADEMVDRDFGTGAVKITPAHDPNDFEVGKRHKLPEIDVMTDDGRMNASAGAYAGMDRFEARKKIVEDLKAQGLLEKIVDHTHAVGLCERSKTVVEPRISTQWFCAMKTLAEPALAAVERGEIQMIPENRRQEYLFWMRNIRDWTLSRQLWWGHRIPAWYCEENGHVTVAREDPSACATCGSKNLKQDPDVLDTWFSSGLWPFSTLGWPEKTADFERYYPTSVLITGYDILFFWVARMVMLGIHFTGQVPFRAVYLHSLVRTGSGEKMSKSKGTGFDPVALNQQYGTDAMRFCLASMAAPGTDIVLSEDRLLGARAFANKIWNAARFLFMNIERFESVSGPKLNELAAPPLRDAWPFETAGSAKLANEWLFGRLEITINSVNNSLGDYRFHEAAQAVYQFFWGDFCDWYLEWIKPEVALGDPKSSEAALTLTQAQIERAVAAWKNILAAFAAALKLLHPFMPFITEELWHQLPTPTGTKSIALDSFPKVSSKFIESGVAPQSIAQFELLQSIITTVRAMRSEMKLDPKKKIQGAQIYSNDDQILKLKEAHGGAINRLASLSGLTPNLRASPPRSGGLARSTAHFDIWIPYDDVTDVAGESARLKKEIEALSKAVQSKEKQLSNETFRRRAPEKIIKEMEAAMGEQRIELQKLNDRLSQLAG